MMKSKRKQPVYRGISLIMSVVLIASFFYIQTFEMKAAEEPLLIWERSRTMDINFNQGNSVRGSNNMLFSFDVTENGLYELEYYLKNGEQTKIYLYKQLDNMTIYYGLNEKNSSGDIISKLGNPGETINMNQVDYSGLATWVNIDKPIVSLPGSIASTTSSALEFDIEYTQSASVTGFAFELGNANIPNRRVIADWDRPNNTMYIWFDGYVDGNIMPIQLSAPGEDGVAKVDELYVLKNLEEFDIRPVDPRDVEAVIVEYDGTNPEEQAGRYPGMEITFKHPKTWNTSDWSYQYDTFSQEVNASFSMEELTNSDKLLEFEMGLNQAGDTQVRAIASGATADYLYDDTEKRYTVYMAQDISDLDKVDDNIEGHVIEWQDLDSSKLYEATFSVGLNALISGQERYRTDFFEMNAYTYLEYKVVRVDDEAYLDIKPYYVENAQNIYYNILYADENIQGQIESLTLWSSYYPTQTTEEKIRIVVDARWNSNYNFYQVEPVWKGSKLDSQVLNYQASDHEESGLIAPKLPELIAPRGDDISVIGLSDNEPANDLIKFDLQWVGMNRDRWIYKAIYYEVLLGKQSKLDLETPDDIGYDVFAMYKITQNIEQEYELWRITSGTMASHDASDLELVGRYANFDEITGENGVMLKDAEVWTQTIKTEYKYDETFEHYVYDFDFNTGQTLDLDLDEQEVYYLRMRAIAEIEDGLAPDTYISTDYSIPKSITLSETVRELPEIELTRNEPLVEEEKVGVYLEWQEITKQNPQIHDFIRLFLDPQREESQGEINITQDTQIRYKVLISQSREALLYEGTFDPSNYSPEIRLGTATADITNEQLQILKQTQPDGVLLFDVPTNSIGLLGLEENKVYFSRVITTLEVTESPTQTAEYYSEPSEVISITTPTLPQEPDEGDLDPLSPNNFDVRFKEDDEVKLETEVTWNLPDGIDIEGDSFEFEIVAFEEEGFPNIEAATEVPLMDVYTQMLSASEELSENISILEDLIERDIVQGWYVVKEGENYRYTMLSGYMANGDPIYAGETGLCRIDPDSDELIILEDNTNRPNQVYYYYIRSINAYNSLLKSNWRVDTITTGRIQTATNLTVVYDAIDDPYYETVIRFDIPLEAEYANEIHIRGEQDAEYVIARSGSGADNSGDYRYRLIQEEELSNARRLYYRITGLESGKTYNIKVRLIDDTQTDEVDLDGNPAYPESAFSDTITTRTEFNQDDYEEDLKYQEYLEYYRDQAEKLKQKPYFQLETSRNQAAYKYRDAYGIGLIETNRNRSLELVVNEKGKTTYYLPSNFTKALNDGQVMLVYEQDGQKITLRPKSLGLYITSAIGKIQEEINRYNAKNRDYYIEFIVEIDDNIKKVLSYDATSPQVEVTINVVGSEDIEEEVDMMFIYELDHIIRSKEPDLIEELTDELEEGINDARLVELVKNLVSEVEEEFLEETQDIFEDAITGTSYSIQTLAKPMIFELTPTRSTSLANHRMFQEQKGRWVEQVAAYTGGRYQLQTTSLLPLVLGDYYIDETISGNYENDALNILSRYNLMEILGENTLKNPQASLNNQQFIQIMARILGAQKGDDNTQYLKTQGIDVPRLSAYNEIINEEAYYLYVQVYAKKHRIDLSTVKIRNYQLIEDIQEANSTYRDTLLRGVNGGFITIDYGLMLPRQKMTIERLMTLLNNIDG